MLRKTSNLLTMDVEEFSSLIIFLHTTNFSMSRTLSSNLKFPMEFLSGSEDHVRCQFRSSCNPILDRSWLRRNVKCKRPCAKYQNWKICQLIFEIDYPSSHTLARGTLGKRQGFAILTEMLLGFHGLSSFLPRHYFTRSQTDAQHLHPGKKQTARPGTDALQGVLLSSSVPARKPRRHAGHQGT